MNDTTLFPVLILSGGLATRLRPLTEKIPKALVEINGKPFVDHQLRLLKKQGVTEVIMCVGYLGEMVRDYVGNGDRYGLQIDYSFDGDQLLGTGGAIYQALGYIKTDNFFVLYGDSYLICDFKEVQDSFVAQKKLGLMTVFKNNGLWDKSNVEFYNHEILCYDKKNQTEKMQYIDYGLGIFNKKVFNFSYLSQQSDLASIYEKLLRCKELASEEVFTRFYEIGSFSGIKELDEYLV